MFWRFGGYANISTIDTILDKPDFSLDELLDEGDLIQELKQHNAKLIDYLRDEAVLVRLLEYVVAPRLEPVATPDPDAEDQQSDKGKGRVLPFSRPRASSRASEPESREEEMEKKRNRYAYVAAEILASDNWSICEALLAKKALMSEFWEFLKRPTPLDPLQASYFTKVNEALFDKKTEDMIDLLKSIPDAVPNMLRHVDCPMIMDLLLKIISLERVDTGQGIVEWLYTQDTMPTLLSFLAPERSWATQTSAGDFMKAIITVSANASQNEQTCIGPNELTRQLVSKPCIEQLIGYMLGGGNALTVGVGIIIEVIRKNNSDYDPDVGAEANLPPSSRDPIYLGYLLRLFAQHVPDFMNLIMNPPAQKTKINSTFGDKIEPLGFDRFKTCELMAELLHCSNMGLLNEIGSEELITSRDAERQRLRLEGRLSAMRGEEVPSSAEDLTMRMSHSSPADEGRRLEVTNMSDDDGFEEVPRSAGMTEDTSHEFVKAEEEIPAAPPPPTSFLDKDEDDFVDEPLSSPRLKVSNSSSDAQFADPDLVVAPLSPSKRKAAELDDAPPSPSKSKKTDVDDLVEQVQETMKLDKAPTPDPADATASPEESEASTTPAATLTPTVSSVAGSEDAKPESGKSKPGIDETTPPSMPQGLEPYPGDTPPPLFSSQAAAAAAPTTEAIVAAEAGAASQETTKVLSPETAPGPQVGGMTTTETEPGLDDAEEAVESSVLVGRAGEPGTEVPAEAGEPLKPVVGDFLKMQFVEYRVVPTILSFFFRYPWNNFLHNVVYDIVQQVFNGPMDRGYNPTLAISLFENADITTQIINGQRASERSQQETKTRMGYMGHLTLIAEEVVKFTERHPPELLSETVLHKVMDQDWINYVEGALAETRERDNAILGGVRPEVALSATQAGAGLAAVGLSGLGSAFTSALQGGGSSVLAEAGLNGGSGGDVGDGGGNGIGPFAISAGTLMSGFGSSSDEDDDEEADNEEDVNNEVSTSSFFSSSGGRIASGSFAAAGAGKRAFSRAFGGADRGGRSQVRMRRPLLPRGDDDYDLDEDDDDNLDDDDDDDGGDDDGEEGLDFDSPVGSPDAGGFGGLGDGPVDHAMQLQVRRTRASRRTLDLLEGLDLDDASLRSGGGGGGSHAAEHDQQEHEHEQHEQEEEQADPRGPASQDAYFRGQVLKGLRIRNGDGTTTGLSPSQFWHGHGPGAGEGSGSLGGGVHEQSISISISSREDRAGWSSPPGPSTPDRRSQLPRSSESVFRASWMDDDEDDFGAEFFDKGLVDDHDDSLEDVPLSDSPEEKKPADPPMRNGAAPKSGTGTGTNGAPAPGVGPTLTFRVPDALTDSSDSDADGDGDDDADLHQFLDEVGSMMRSGLPSSTSTKREKIT